MEHSSLTDNRGTAYTAVPSIQEGQPLTYPELLVVDEPPYPDASASTSRNWAAIAALVLLLSLGIFLRLPYGLFSSNQPLHAVKPLHPTPKLTELGFDEGLYCGYVGTLNSVGLSNYPRIVDHYITLQ